jgi:hypothetical protein
MAYAHERCLLYSALRNPFKRFNQLDRVSRFTTAILFSQME